MALADILAAMEAQVEAEINRIMEQSAATAAQIRAAAESDARAIRERHRRNVLVPLQHERARRLNRARLAALRAASRAREKLFADALERARARLTNVRAAPDYAILLRALLEEALAHIDGEALVHADVRDEQILHVVFPHMQISYDLQTWGGVEARTRDGNIAVVNTLEARLEQAHDLLRQAVMPLFDSQAEAWLTMTMPTHDSVR